MPIRSLRLKNFRCFENFTLHFNEQLTFITGQNGSGKSSLLEALHYSCYLKSFRTKQYRSLINLEAKNFIIKVDFDAEESHELHIAWGNNQRLIKLDDAVINSYKELTALYKIVTLSADDLTLIQGDPESRRSFIDQSLLLYKPSLVLDFKTAKKLTDQRNALLVRGIKSDDLQHAIWTEKLWKITRALQQERINFIALLQDKINTLTTQLLGTSSLIILQYVAKHSTLQDELFDTFYKSNAALWQFESFMKRSGFGIQLDDIIILFKDKKSRNFASRGQQKLIAIILKIAFMQILLQDYTKALFLLDDFFTDLDEATSKKLLDFVIALGCQLIITATHITIPYYCPQGQSYDHIQLLP